MTRSEDIARLIRFDTGVARVTRGLLVVFPRLEPSTLLLWHVVLLFRVGTLLTTN